MGPTTTAGNIEIRALRPDLLNDFLRFFEEEAFVDNPAWGSCYCCAYMGEYSGEEWGARTGEQNRSTACGLIAAGAMHGYLAYIDGRLVGWCNAAARSRIPAFNSVPPVDADDNDKAGAIVCFVVAPAYRKRGVARALLNAACDGFRAAGLHVAQAHPIRGREGDADNYPGPLAMYLEAGFHEVRSFGDIVLVRKRLVDAPGGTTAP